MRITSLGFATDIALLRHAGSLVEDHGDHLVIRTPDNPSYFWGNFVLFASAPGAERGLSVFAEAFPDADHVSLGVDDGSMSDAERADFEAEGVEVDTAGALVASSLVAPASVAAEVRPLVSDADWEARKALELAGDEDYPAAEYAEFMARRNAMERRLVDAGLGQRFAAFVDGEAVSTAAIFDCGDGVWRYQAVMTHPAHRRRGLAAATVHAAGAHALAAGARQLVIVADHDGPAISTYRRLGFVDTEPQLMLERRGGVWARRTP